MPGSGELPPPAPGASGEEWAVSEAARTVRPMSMNGEYLRVTTTELAWALEDSAWAWNLSQAAQDMQELVWID